MKKRNWIKAAAAMKGIKLKDLAKAVGVTQATMTNYINGTHSPRVEVAKRMSELLDVEWQKFIE